MNSQNVSFAGAVPEDAEFEHPRGMWLARLLASEVEKAGWQTGEIENWNDVGWSIGCSQGATRLTVAFAEWGINEWLLQIHPSDTPGLIRRLLGAQPSAIPSDIVALSNVIHNALEKTGRFSYLRWRADGPPDEEHSTPRPVSGEA